MSVEQTVDLVFLLLVFGFPFAMFLAAWGIGGAIESRHFASIRTREARLLLLPAVPVRSPESGRRIAESRLVTGSVVISNDHFKRVVARLRMVFGGRVRVYEGLVDRARREAVLRMKEQWPEADAILNVRLETSGIAQTSSDRGVGAFEVLAYGTAIRYA